MAVGGGEGGRKEGGGAMGGGKVDCLHVRGVSVGCYVREAVRCLHNVFVKPDSRGERGGDMYETLIILGVCSLVCVCL